MVDQLLHCSVGSIMAFVNSLIAFQVAMLLHLLYLDCYFLLKGNIVLFLKVCVRGTCEQSESYLW